MNQIFEIILGLTILCTANLVVVLLLVLFYFKAVKRPEAFMYKFKLSLLLSVTNILVQFLTLIILSNNGLLIYVVSAFVLSLIGFLAVMKFGYKYQLHDNAVIATSLAILLNPFWLNIFGILT